MGLTGRMGRTSISSIGEAENFSLDVSLYFLGSGPTLPPPMRLMRPAIGGCQWRMYPRDSSAPNAGGASTHKYLLKNCPQWRRQQNILRAEVRKVA